MTSLYIHIPFCNRKCFYCSFAVTIGQQKHVTRYLDCLAKEARKHSGEKIISIYLGGGTPSLLASDELARLRDIIYKTYDCFRAVEKTIELNPEDVNQEKATLWKALGFNRISLGVQSFNDRILGFLGRCHNSQQALLAFDILRAAGFKNINLDMMFALPGQRREDIKQDFKMIAELQCEHVSLYGLSVEEYSRFYVQKVRACRERQQIGLYTWALQFFKEHGLHQYEVSNFAKSGKESRHNVHYWQGGDYIGLGMAAHSHQGGRRSWNINRFKPYMLRIENSGDATEGFEILSAEQRLWETIVFGLRMTCGVDLKKTQRRLRQTISEEKWIKVLEFVKAGFLSYHGGILKTTQKGQLLLDELSAYLV